MTLVLSCLTQEYVVQVSDRRLTFIDDGTVKDDDTNKAVVFCGHIAFGYTGLDKLDGVPTDHWLMRVLGNGPQSPLSEVNGRVESAATTAMASVPLEPQHKRQAFAAAGWAHRAAFGLQPLAFCTSNFQDKSGHWSPLASRTFSTRYTGLRPTATFQIAEAGQRLHPPELSDLKAKLRRQIRAGPAAAIMLLAQAIRTVASRNQMVGKKLMAVSLPKCAIGVDFALTGPLTPQPESLDFLRDKPSALYLPSDAGEVVTYSPNYVCFGLQIGSVISQPLPPGGIDVPPW